MYVLRRIALERFAKAFNLEVPESKPTSSNAAFSEMPSLGNAAAFQNMPFSYNGGNSLPFDFSALPDSNWVGSEVFPEWIKGDTSDQDWTFDAAWTDGIDRVSLGFCKTVHTFAVR